MKRMTTRARPQFGRAESDARPRDERPPHSGRLRHVLGLVVTAAAVALTVWLFVSARQQAERGALLQMSDADRRALYEDTRRNAETLCKEAVTQDGLAERCGEAARFLLSFPECDAECAAFARAHQPAATR